MSEASRTWNMKLLGADRARIVCDQKFDKIGITLRNVGSRKRGGVCGWGLDEAGRAKARAVRLLRVSVA